MIANMDKQPHISVLMSVFNAEEVISDAIESILDQDYENFEFLIMNDASTDGTPSILETYQTSDSRMKVFHNKENLGLTVSLNKLIHNSKGNIIFRQDADDTSYLNRLSFQVQQMQEKGYNVCVTKAKVKGSKKARPHLSYYLPYKLVMKLKNPFIHGTLAIRRETLLEVGTYDENFYFAQDYKLYAELINKKYKIHKIYKILYNLNTFNNISTKFASKQKYYSDCVKKKKLPDLRFRDF